MAPEVASGGYVVSAGIIEGELWLGLSSGAIIKAGLVRGAPGKKGDIGPPGPRGEDGADGCTILNGPRRPTPTDGKEGDFWLDITATELWGPKVGGRWQGPVSFLSEAARRDRTRGPGPREQSRFFGAGGITAPGIATEEAGGLKPIIGNDQPFPAGSPVVIAKDPTGLAMHVLIRAETATGAFYGEVATSFFGMDAQYTVNWEMFFGTAPDLTFFPQVVGGRLQLALQSDVPLTKLLGRIAYV